MQGFGIFNGIFNDFALTVLLFNLDFVRVLALDNFEGILLALALARV
jgi:hypothetical protein